MDPPTPTPDTTPHSTSREGNDHKLISKNPRLGLLRFNEKPLTEIAPIEDGFLQLAPTTTTTTATTTHQKLKIK